METNPIRLRVHFAPVGVEVLRVTEPMKTLHADVALLLTVSQTDRTRFNVENIMRDLKESRIQAQVVECNILSTSEVVNEVGSIVTASPQHDYLFNVSTGTRTAGIAGVIAGMFWRMLPYYVAVDEQAKPVYSERDFPSRGFPQFVPTFEIPLLDKATVAALEYIAGQQEPMSKRMLLAHLRDNGVVGPRQKRTVSSQALHGQVDSILRRLESWGFINLAGRGKLMRVRITDKGIEGRKMFFHVLNPRKPLPILTTKT
jgi:hypothetical protein